MIENNLVGVECTKICSLTQSSKLQYAHPIIYKPREDHCESSSIQTSTCYLVNRQMKLMVDLNECSKPLKNRLSIFVIINLEFPRTIWLTTKWEYEDDHYEQAMHCVVAKPSQFNPLSRRLIYCFWALYDQDSTYNQLSRYIHRLQHTNSCQYWSSAWDFMDMFAISNKVI